jgi:hypothetical protein
MSSTPRFSWSKVGAQWLEPSQCRCTSGPSDRFLERGSQHSWTAAMTTEMVAAVEVPLALQAGGHCTSSVVQLTIISSTYHLSPAPPHVRPS